MGFQTPLYELADYLKWTTSGKIQLPDFQRGYKWEDERIRQLLVTILRGHPLGVVMLLKTGNDQSASSRKPVEGSRACRRAPMPSCLLLDGQQRLTSLTQALTGDGVVATMDSRGKLLERRYYVDIALALEGEDRIDEAVVSCPATASCARTSARTSISTSPTPDKEREQGYFPVRLLFGGAETVTWLFALDDKEQASQFHAQVDPAGVDVQHPGDRARQVRRASPPSRRSSRRSTLAAAAQRVRAAHRDFAGDKELLRRSTAPTSGSTTTGEDPGRVRRAAGARRRREHRLPAGRDAAGHAKRNLADTEREAAGDLRKREDILKLTLDDYLEWVDPLREAFLWVGDVPRRPAHLRRASSCPTPSSWCRSRRSRWCMGDDADLHRRRASGSCGGSGAASSASCTAARSRPASSRDLEQVPAWAMRRGRRRRCRGPSQDASFVESRLHSLRTRNAAAYKGSTRCARQRRARLDGGQGPRQGAVRRAWPSTSTTSSRNNGAWTHGIDDERRESIVNKTAIVARHQPHDRRRGAVEVPRGDREEGAASPPPQLDDAARRAICRRRRAARRRLRRTSSSNGASASCMLVEKAMGKPVQRDVDDGRAEEASEQFEPTTMVTATPDEED